MWSWKLATVVRDYEGKIERGREREREREKEIESDQPPPPGCFINSNYAYCIMYIPTPIAQARLFEPSLAKKILNGTPRPNVLSQKGLVRNSQ